jgi:hypothetical protein
MNYSSIPVIVIMSYLVGEIYKVIFKENKDMYKLIPVLVTVFGGLLGVLMYITNKETINNASNIWEYVEIGLISGASSTTTNQIVKQLFNKEGEKLE